MALYLDGEQAGKRRRHHRTKARTMILLFAPALSSWSPLGSDQHH